MALIRPTGVRITTHRAPHTVQVAPYTFARVTNNMIKVLHTCAVAPFWNPTDPDRLRPGSDASRLLAATATAATSLALLPASTTTGDDSAPLPPASSIADAVRPDDVRDRVRFCFRARHAARMGMLSSSDNVLLRRLRSAASLARRRCSRRPTGGVSAFVLRRSRTLSRVPGSSYAAASLTPAAANPATLSRSALRPSSQRASRGGPPRSPVASLGSILASNSRAKFPHHLGALARPLLDIWTSVG